MDNTDLSINAPGMGSPEQVLHPTFLTFFKNKYIVIADLTAKELCLAKSFVIFLKNYPNMVGACGTDGYASR